MERDTERQSSFFRFEDLRIYHKALDYITWVHNTTNLFPESERDCMTIPFLKSAQAIALNIAEGSARNKNQFIYYLKMAKSSVRECVVYTEMIKNLKLINDEVEEDSRNHLMELTKMIGALIASLQRSGHKTESPESEKVDVDEED